MLEILWNKASRIRNAMLATKPTKPNKEPKLHAELSLLYKHFPLCHPFADIHPNTTTEQIWKIFHRLLNHIIHVNIFMKLLRLDLFPRITLHCINTKWLLCYRNRKR